MTGRKLRLMTLIDEFNPSRKDPHWGRRKLKRDT
jgi:hypothetical protein